MKLAFEDGRPFMYTNKIYPYVCEVQFGNPSDELVNFTSLSFAGAFYLIKKSQE
jgi:hypothetical protein